MIDRLHHLATVLACLAFLDSCGAGASVEEPGPEVGAGGAIYLFEQELSTGSTWPEIDGTTDGSESATEVATRSFLSTPLDSGGGEAFEPEHVRLENGYRRAIVLPAPARLAWQVELPVGAQLELSAGLQPRAIAAGDEGPELEPANGRALARVLVEEEGGESTPIWEAAFEAGSWSWRDARIDLARWSGEVVRLVLVSEGGADHADAHLLLAWGEPVVLGEAAGEPPNVLVLLLDTLRADRLGCYGNERGLTPNLDALAARGLRFADATSAASWTLPAHASLFTSTYVSQHGVWRDQVLPAGLPTLAEVLRDAGYRTGAFTEGGYLDTAHGFARGHSHYDSRIRDCEQTFARAAEWIEERRTPWYAFVHTYQVHSPHDPPPAQRERFVRSYAGDLPESVQTPDYQWGRKSPPPSEADARYVEDLYDAEVAYLDKRIGAFLARLEDAGALEDTLILVTSDHGEEFFEHGASNHGHSLYQEQLHVPLLLAWPGHVEGGRVAKHPVHAVDVAPTLAQAAGAPIPEGWVGAPLRGEPGPQRRPIFVPMRTYLRKDPERSGEPAVSLRNGDLKFVRYPADLRPYDEHPGAALFDLGRDPGERVNLLDEERERSFARELEALYRRYAEVEGGGTAEYDAALLRELHELGYVGDEE